MSHRSDAGSGCRELGALVEETRVRVLNCSATGCLLETDRRLNEGTVATLDVTLGGRSFSDALKVVRCEPAERTPGLYFVGTRFLSIAPAHPGTIRHAMRHDSGGLAEWLDAEDGQ